MFPKLEHAGFWSDISRRNASIAEVLQSRKVRNRNIGSTRQLNSTAALETYRGRELEPPAAPEIFNRRPQ